MHASGSPPTPTLHVVDPRRARRRRRIIAGVWVVTVLTAYIVGRYVMIPDADGLSAQLEASNVALASLRERLSDTEQRLVIVERAEQIARLANENVQIALTEKDDEIADLRRELAVYDRLIGPGAERQGLAVYDMMLRPVDNGSVAFKVILTQTRDVRRGSQGHLTLSVEGRRNGQLERIEWPELSGAGDEAGLPYDFRYFQRIEGQFMLPADFQPLSVRAVLNGQGSETVERTVPWEQAVKTSRGN